MAKYIVTVRECTSEGREKIARVCVPEASQATSAGVRKIYGRRSWFQQDSGLVGYGQIFRRTGPLQHTALTDRVRITVEEEIV